MDSKITVYGADWCGDTRRTRKQLDALGLPYDYVDIDEDKAAEAWITEQNNGKRKTPTVSDQLPCTLAKAPVTTSTAGHSNSPTCASLKSLGAMISRHRKSRQNSSSITGTTSTAPIMRTATNAHWAVGDANALKGSNTSAGGWKREKCFWSQSCIATH